MSAAPPYPAFESPDDSKPRVLLVDDDEVLLRSYARALEAQGYDVHPSRDGEQAIRALAESTFDVRRLMEQLPKNMRCSIEAVKLDGLSIAEAAKRCGISEPGVKMSIHRGLKRLAAMIARETQA